MKNYCTKKYALSNRNRRELTNVMINVNGGHVQQFNHLGYSPTHSKHKPMVAPLMHKK